ncbi:MAG: hypothetical protein AAF682_02245 [Planctomycetota bacterium]
MMLHALLFAAAGLTPSVHTVDDTPGTGADFADIQTAIDFAADGDTILIFEGDYPAFVLDGKDVALEADNLAEVFVGGSTIRNIPAGSEVLLRRLNFLATDTDALLVEQCGGTVWVEECGFDSELSEGTFQPGGDGLVLDTVADARVLRSFVSGGHGSSELFLFVVAQPGGAGLRAKDSSVVLMDSLVTGGHGGGAAFYGILHGGDGGDAVALEGSTLQAWGNNIQAGNGGYGDYCDCPGGLICGIPGTGGDAIEVVAASTTPSVELLDTTLLAGAPGLSGSLFGMCPDGAPGNELAAGPADVVTLPGPHRSFWTKSPARDAGPAALYFYGEPGDLAIIALGPSSSPFELPGITGTLFLSPTAQVLFSGPWDPSVLEPLVVNIPDQPAGFETLRLYTQGAVVTPLGEIRLIDPATLVLIDDSF